MNKLLNVDLNRSAFTYNFSDEAEAGDIYLVGDSVQDLTRDLYKGDFYVLLGPTESGYLVAPFDTLENEYHTETNDTKVVQLLIKVSTYKNIEAFKNYVFGGSDVSIYEKQRVSRPFGTQVRWIKKTWKDDDVDFVSREYKRFIGDRK